MTNTAFRRTTKIVCDFDRYFAQRYDPAFYEGAASDEPNPYNPNTQAFAHLGYRDGQRTRKGV